MPFKILIAIDKLQKSTNYWCLQFEN